MDSPSAEAKEEVRKWLNRFFKDGDHQEDFWARVSTYEAQNGHMPRTNDIIWGMLNDRRSEFLSEGLFGLYRNETLSMYTLLDLEDRFDHLLIYASWVTALDGMGATNSGKFDPERAWIAPICPGLISESALLAHMSLADVQAEFLRHSESLLEGFRITNHSYEARRIWGLVEADVQSQFTHGLPKRRKRKPAPILTKT